MIKIEKTDVFGFDSAIRGMRNPMNSWDKSDSEMRVLVIGNRDGGYDFGAIVPYIGENDLKLMKSLSKAGSDHAKFLRMINVTVDITAPRYWWTEFDTYKVGTVANSCSTMHKIHDKELTLDDFSHEQLTYYEVEGELCRDWLGDLEDLIGDLNFAREKFIETNDEKYWLQMIKLLPQSYNQKRTVQLNYQVLKSMYFARRNHKLDEWHTLCDWMLELPYFREICIDMNE